MVITSITACWEHKVEQYKISSSQRSKPEPNTLNTNPCFLHFSQDPTFGLVYRRGRLKRQYQQQRATVSSKHEQASHTMVMLLNYASHMSHILTRSGQTAQTRFKFLTPASSSHHEMRKHVSFQHKFPTQPLLPPH